MWPEPAATYRLQLRPGFGFADASEVIPYLAALGITHLYCSPYLQAAAGSAHGYDVVDPTRVNTELGGQKEHQRMLLVLKDAGMGQVLDLVPNHMAITGQENPWWWDVLENGPSSPHASFFDVDWEASEDRWPNKVLLPVLGDHYGRVLEAGELLLAYEQYRFILNYYDQSFPVDYSSLSILLARAAENCGSDLLGFIADACAGLPRPTVTKRKVVKRRHRDKTVIGQLLAGLYSQAGPRAAIEAEVKRINQDQDALDRLIEDQNYRLAWWRTAERDLGYRRFFDINTLVGLRVEDEEVFAATHALPLGWVQEGSVQGLRIDHPDGLRDPAGYFRRLREKCPNAWIVAEKILEPGEELPRDWPVQGTTGYDFLNLVGGLFVDQSKEEILTGFYTEFTGQADDFETLVRKCKRLVISDLLGSELNRLTSLFVAVCEKHRRHRDYTRHELQEALLRVGANFPVYRSYVRAGQDENKANNPVVSDSDRSWVQQAVALVGEESPDLDPELLIFLKKILLLEIGGILEGELAMRFQQFTAPVMAKGVEDTAFYRYNRLLCLNEVGGDPGCFGISLQEFHRQGELAWKQRPLSLLAGSTHDTKRSEDVRARLALLSEIPEKWRNKVLAWSELNRKYKTGDWPESNIEYFIYQTLAGAWPISPERLKTYLEKAMREAKERTSWTRPDVAYEQAVQRFARAVLEDDRFCREMEDFLEPLIPAGRVNSLSQTLIRLTFPGVPDIYQGCELWDMSLVDPDNRHPVDFGQRQRLLADLPDIGVQEIMLRMDEGLPKMWLVWQALHLRRSRPEAFGIQGDYCPVYAAGKKAQHVVAFLRGGQVLTVAPRLVLGLGNDWEDTVLDLPPGVWENTLTGEVFAAGRNKINQLLGRFPVALLARGPR